MKDLDTKLGLSTTGGGDTHLRIEFEHDSDRYAHHVFLCQGSTRRRLLSSVESTGDRWPASPAIQQLSRQQMTQGTDFLAGVGMAGTSHWSISADASPDAPVIQIDVACRAKQPPQWLGSTYRISPEFQALQVESAIVLTNPGTPNQMKLEIDDVHGPRLDLEGHTCRLATDCVGPFPQTVRWKYRILICP